MIPPSGAARFVIRTCKPPMSTVAESLGLAVKPSDSIREA